MAIFFTFFTILSLSVIGLVLYSTGGNFSPGMAEFLAKGSEAGLTPTEIKTLKRAADYLEMDKPLLLLGSMVHVDRAIQDLSQIIEDSLFRDSDAVDILEDLFKYRKKVELKRIERKNIIISSREIDAGQRVKVTLGSNNALLRGSVMTNSPEYLVVDFTTDNNISSVTMANGLLNVYFWKKNDAGYHFESSVVDSTLGNIWKISHSNRLIRSQKRQNVRKDVNLPGYTTKLEDISKMNTKLIGNDGTNIQVKNISEGGLAFLINGRVPKNTALKVEFMLESKRIIICGMVKESIFNDKKGISLVRFIFVEPGVYPLTVIKKFLYDVKSKNKITEIAKSVENEVELYKNVGIDDAELDTVAEVEYLPEDNEVFI